MTTGSAAKAGHSEKDKEKAGIRRALGRGLESLLPGPRRVGTDSRVASSERQSAMDAPVGEIAEGSEQQVPQRLTAIRNDIAAEVGPVGRSVVEIQGVVEEADGAELSSARPGSFDSAQDGLEPGATQFVQAPEETPTPPLQVAQGRNDNRGVSESISLQASAEGRQDSRAGVPAPHSPAPHGPAPHGPAPHGGAPHSTLVVQIPLHDIDENPYQTRNLVDQQTLQDLAESIKAQGVVQPVVVRPAEGGRYVLILGERRCRASKMAGKTSIPAIVRRVSDQQAAEMTIIENLQREDLNCMEQAKAFGVLSREFRMTQEQIGLRVGKSREAVSNYMRLLRLPQTVIDYLENNQLAFSDARELMMLNDDKLIARAADIAVKKHLSIEKIEDLVMEMQGLGENRPWKKVGGARWVDPNVRAAQTELERLLGVRVRIRDRKGKGKIVIEYSTVDDYERVVEALRGKSST